MDENLTKTPNKTTDADVLYFDPYKLSNEVLPCFTQSCNSLSSSASIISSISIPDDFEYAGELSRIPAKINEVANSVGSIAKWLAYDIITPMIEVDTDKNAGIVKGMGDINYESIAERLLNGERFVTVGIDEKITTLVKPKTIDGFIKCLDLLLKQHKKESWEWKGLGTSGGLIYERDGTTTFEDLINNPNKATCCATFVSMGMYLAGFADVEDFQVTTNITTGETKFNANRPNDVYNACVNLGAMQVLGDNRLERYENLEIGDIVIFYEDRDEPGKGTHVQVYGGKTEDGRDIFYSEGSDIQVQNGGPVAPDAPYWYVTEWKAYRLQTDSDETFNLLDDKPNQGSTIATALGTDTPISNDNNIITASLGTDRPNNNENNTITANLEADTLSNNGANNVTANVGTNTAPNNYNNGIASNLTAKKKDEEDGRNEDVNKKSFQSTEDNIKA